MGYQSVLRLGLVMAMLGWPTGSSWAETLQDAFARAYMGNPTLRAARARQRASDEQVPQALSGWRPTVTVRGSLTHSETWFKSGSVTTFKTESDTSAVSITLQQPLFRGFQTIEGTRVAEANVRAGRQNLLATEQEVLFDAASSYMNVFSGRQLVRLQQENVQVLEGQLRAANERFNVGEITRTDVAQARASLSAAKGELADARADLGANAAEYLQIIGKEPGKLSYPKVSRLPSSLQKALNAAAELNPNILAAAFVEDASVHAIKVARAPLLPQAALQASGNYNNNLAEHAGHTYSTSISASVSMPLYEAGAVYSRVREAKQLASQRRINVIIVERAVRRAVTAAWNFLVASREGITAAGDQVEAAKLALDGVQQEYEAGTRTLQDVLDAQAVVVEARTNLVNAQRSQVIASYQLLAAVGRLTARDMALNVPLYDVEENYRAVRNKFIGTDAETVE